MPFTPQPWPKAQPQTKQTQSRSVIEISRVTKFQSNAVEEVSEGFSYTSDTNDQWLSVEQIREWLEALED